MRRCKKIFRISLFLLLGIIPLLSSCQKDKPKNKVDSKTEATMYVNQKAIDFGLLKVGEEKEKEFLVETKDNTGLVTFSITGRSKELFSIVPFELPKEGGLAKIVCNGKKEEYIRASVQVKVGKKIHTIMLTGEVVAK